MALQSHFSSNRSMHLRTTASLLLVIFCFFRYERYQSSSLTNPAAPVQTCGQTEAAAVDYHLPALSLPALVNEDPAVADLPAPDRFHRCDEQRFSAKTQVLFRCRSSENCSAVNIALPCRVHYRKYGHTGETPAALSS
jgi:hypothetical protein